MSTIQALADQPLILDTHQHLWDPARMNPPWLKGAHEILRKRYGLEEYADATRGLNVQAVYMEVDVAEEDLDREAELILGYCREGKHATRAATLGGRPASPGFEAYVKRHKASGFLKGVRQVLHNADIPAGLCLKDDFVKGVRMLGAHGLHFDLCMRPTELQDAGKLAEFCPDTRLVVDHCGNGDPRAFFPQLAPSEKPIHEVAAWKRDIQALAAKSNVICKISGIVARAPKGWKPEHLAPVVNHCLDSFGPDRVIFGSDWPVCLLGSDLRTWVTALQAIVSNRPVIEQTKLWSENARKLILR
jgi:predicted TIM-barrel fold metal-dependent hydrolase